MSEHDSRAVGRHVPKAKPRSAIGVEQLLRQSDAARRPAPHQWHERRRDEEVLRQIVAAAHRRLPKRCQSLAALLISFQSRRHLRSDRQLLHRPGIIQSKPQRQHKRPRPVLRSHSLGRDRRLPHVKLQQLVAFERRIANARDHRLHVAAHPRLHLRRRHDLLQHAPRVVHQRPRRKFPDDGSSGICGTSVA